MFIIKGRYSSSDKVMGKFPSLIEAMRVLLEYRIAFGKGWVLWLDREKA